MTELLRRIQAKIALGLPLTSQETYIWQVCGGNK